MKKMHPAVLLPAFLFSFFPFSLPAQLISVIFNGVREVNTGIQWGGRTYSLAVNPANTDMVIAGTESGGLNKTINRGTSWQHLDNFPCRNVNDVAFTDNTGLNLLATTNEDFRNPNGAGIWRSSDGGNSWAPCSVSFSPGATCSNRMIAWGIARTENRILVATSCGIAISTDGGISFTHNNVRNGNFNFLSIAATGRQVIAGGSGGIFFSGDEGDNFAQETSGIGIMDDFHGLCWSEDFGLGNPIAYAINNNSQLFYSLNGGRNWTRIFSAPAGGGNCGGTRFVTSLKTGENTQKLFYGNRCSAFVMNARRTVLTPGTYTFLYRENWVATPFQHGADCYQVVFDTRTSPAQPYMLATDGGVEATTDGGASWASVGRAQNGFNALQVIDVKGQVLNDGAASKQTLYFGTQDNWLWASDNGGRTFPYSSNGGEGFNFQMARRANAATARMHYIICTGCVSKISKPFFVEAADWNNIASPLGAPMLVEEGIFLQARLPLSGRRAGFSLTDNLGSDWRTITSLDGTYRGAPQLGTTATGYVLYQGMLKGTDPTTNADSVVLTRTTPFAVTGTATPTLSFAAMRNFGTFGIMSTMWTKNEVYGVDYQNPNNIIAADYLNRKMKRSTNGGNDWQDLDDLTNMITRGSRFNFRIADFLPFGLNRYTQAAVVSYHPEISGFVVVGTQEGGVFFSSDNGSSWSEIPGSRAIQTASSVYWTNDHRIFISSYGRGIWEIRYTIRNRLADMRRLCRNPCWRWADPRRRVIIPDRTEVQFAHVFMARGAQIRGYRTKAGILTEVFVAPGTQTEWFSADNQEKIPAIKIVETEKEAGFDGNDEFVQSQGKQQQYLQAIGLNEQGEPELMFTEKMIEPRKSEPVKAVQELSGAPLNEKQPLLIIGSPNMNNGLALITPERPTLTLGGKNFAANMPVEIWVDDKFYEKTISDKEGAFSFAIKIAFSTGMHNMKAMQKTDTHFNIATGVFLCTKGDK